MKHTILIETGDYYPSPTTPAQRAFNKRTRQAEIQLIKDIITLCEDHYTLCHYGPLPNDPESTHIAENSQGIFETPRPHIIP